MKTDLISSIGVAIFGILIAYFLTNLLIGPIEEISFKTVDSSLNTTLVDPNPEVFNYKSINPTVEAFVGECTEVDAYGECIEENTENSETNNQGNQ